MNQLRVIRSESISAPIQKSPGFAKKLLSDFKLDLLGRCGYQCSYCSTNHGLSLTFRKQSLAAAARAQLGESIDVTNDANVTVVWPDVLARLEEQLQGKQKTWGAGKTLVVSMLTDAFSPSLLSDGTTERALRLLLERTSFRIRILTKCDIVGRSKWIDLFAAHPGRFVVGLSIGTLDDTWARRVEIGTSSPSARLRALHALQDAGIPTYGMLCPMFPDMLLSDGVEQLLNAIRPALCEHVWAEPYNDRQNWQAVRSGYDPSSRGYVWMTQVYEHGHAVLWNDYAVELYRRLRQKLRFQGRSDKGGCLDKLRYLLYEDAIDEDSAPYFGDLTGVLLQSKPGPDGLSANPHMAKLQRRAQDRARAQAPLSTPSLPEETS